MRYFRRYILQIIRIEVLKDTNFLGRVDRDIEDVIPFALNLDFSKTVPVYDVLDIAQKTLLLLEIFLSLQNHINNGGEKIFSAWIIKQVNHETEKLKFYL